jgi:ligand-binding sensor domain-containing protein/serine phosphatase RsbU (regulator of sigma subunit)
MVPNREKTRRGNAAYCGCVLLALCAVFLPAVSWSTQLEFERYSLDEGLSQSSVFSMMKDHRGFMWFCTESGLNRFDGYQFTVFKNLPFDSTSISHNNIRNVCEDDSGYLWVATNGGGVNVFDWRTETFKHYFSVQANAATIGSDFVAFIYHDRKDRIWVFTNAGGVERYDRRRDAFVRYRPHAGGLDALGIRCVYQQANGTLWLGTTRGLNYYDETKDDFINYPAPRNGWRQIIHLYEAPSDTGKLWICSSSSDHSDASRGLYLLNVGTGTVRSFTYRPKDPAGLASRDVVATFEDRNRTIWVATSRGLHRLDRATGRFHCYLPRADHPDEPQNSIRAIVENQIGMLLVGTNDADGFYSFDRSTGRFEHYEHDPGNPSSLSNNQILCGYEDSTGVMWFGNNIGGINKTEYFSHKFSLYRSLPGDTNSLSSGLVRSMCQDREGRLWVGCSQTGLNRYDARREKVSHFRYNEQDETSISNDNIWALYVDRDGTLWVGTLGGGLNRFDPVKQSFVRYQHDSRNDSTLSDNAVRAIYQDSKKRLWIGTDFGGLNVFDPQHQRFVRYQHDEHVPASLSNNSVRAIAEDKAGKLWLGTFGGGLEKWDPEQGHFTHYRNNAQDTCSLSSNFLQSLYIDDAGIIWIGTFGGGLNRFDPATGHCRHFTDSNSDLADNVIYGVLGDEKGNIWCSSNRGLSRYNPRYNLFTNYDVFHGLQSKEFNGQACYKSPQGELFFGGINGLNAFFPEQVKDNPFPPRIVLTGLRIFNEPVVIGPRSPLQQHISAVNEIELTHKQNDITFEFVGLHYNRPQDNRYAYQLVNYDAKWRMAGHQRFATYTNLHPGKYVFRVIGCNSDGRWNKKGAQVQVVIRPPWFKTNWAYGLFALLFMAAVVSAFKFQHGHLIKREREKAYIANAELRASAAEAQARAVQAENERQSHELEEARRLQLSMLPTQLPQVAGLDIAVHMETATEVGGDFYDFNLQPDGTLTVVIGDATGHGLKAGTMVSVLKGLFTAYGGNGQSRDFFQICTHTIRQMHMGNLYMALALLKIRDNECWVSSAGMPPIYLYRREARQVEEVLLKGMPLGAFPDFPYQNCSKTLCGGDTLLLLSDGLAEIFNDKNEILDYPRIRSAFEEIGHLQASEIVRHLSQLVVEWRNGRELHDDVTFVVIKKQALA